jgi:hypothetical protein
MRWSWIGIAVVTAMVLGAAVPARAEELNSSDMAGSVLVFPKFIRGTVVVGRTSTNARIVEPRSSFNVSVTCPGGQRCAEGTTVTLVARWVCPGSQDFSEKFICASADFNLVTTVKGTITFNPENAGTRSDVLIPRPPCDRGYLIVWVINAAGEPIKFDALAGNAVLRNDKNSASSYTAFPIQAVSGLPTGASTDVNNDGRLQFDGRTEYKAITGQLAGPVRFTRQAPVAGTNLGAIDTILTFMTLDVQLSRSNSPTFVDLHFYNESEVLISTFHEFVCWSEVKLTTINRNLNEFFGGGGRHGLFETTGAEQGAFDVTGDPGGPVTLLGIAETIERNANGVVVREWAYTLVNSGVAVPTVLAP